jgi:hypothetical protein
MNKILYPYDFKGGKIVYTCPVCHYEFDDANPVKRMTHKCISQTTIYPINGHKITVTNGEEEYPKKNKVKCQYCGKEFSTRGIKRHEQACKKKLNIQEIKEEFIPEPTPLEVPLPEEIAEKKFTKIKKVKEPKQAKKFSIKEIKEEFIPEPTPLEVPLPEEIAEKKFTKTTEGKKKQKGKLIPKPNIEITREDDKSLPKNEITKISKEILMSMIDNITSKPKSKSKSTPTPTPRKIKVSINKPEPTPKFKEKIDYAEKLDDKHYKCKICGQYNGQRTGFYKHFDKYHSEYMKK